MKYKSITTWQGEPEWELTITLGKFDDIETAARFGNEDIKKLKYDKSQLKLFILTEDGAIYQVQSHQLVVSKQKPETMGKLIVDYRDFEAIEVKIEDFPKIDGLNSGFECLSYGVIDENGNYVNINEYSDRAYEEFRKEVPYYGCVKKIMGLRQKSSVQMDLDEALSLAKLLEAEAPAIFAKLNGN